MSTLPGDATYRHTAQHGFPTTLHHELIAARQVSSPTGELALNRVCQAYWTPIYSFIRHNGYPARDAQDLTQAFFLHLLENNAVAKWAPERGRFRNFLLRSLKNFLADRSQRNGEASHHLPDPNAEKMPRPESTVAAHQTLSRFDDSLALWPNHSLLYALTARDLLEAHAMRKDPRWLLEADWMSQRAMALNKTNENCILTRAAYLQQKGDLAAALAVLQTGSSCATRPKYFLQWGTLLELLQQPEEALNVYSSAPKQPANNNPFPLRDQGELLLHQASLFLQQGDPVNAGICRQSAHNLDIPHRNLLTPVTCVDLSPYYNAKLNTDWRRNVFDQHNLSLLPQGLQVLDDITYDIRGAIQLSKPCGSPWLLPYPDFVNAIPLHQHCSRLHFLHATAMDLDPPGREIGHYTIHMENGEAYALQLRQGYEIHRWDRPKSIPDPNTGWKGLSPAGLAVGLSHFVWTNPQPQTAVSTIDFSSLPNQYAPFLVAISFEQTANSKME
ncbi:MAG: hypothetical protein RI897_2942 [Verrucomicrobiota bacterium]|jgi:tetratricopeptide (TPR) repeat protein